MFQLNLKNKNLSYIYIYNSCTDCQQNKYKKYPIIYMLKNQQRQRESARNKQQIVLIPQTVPYKNSHEPLLSNQKKQTIQQKLKLQKQAIQHTKQRQNQGQFYFQYNYNPFLQIKGPDTKIILKRANQKVNNIIDKLNQLQDPYPTVKPSAQQRSVNLNLLKVLNSNFSQKIINNIQKAKQLGLPINTPFQIQPKQKYQQKAVSSFEKDENYYSFQQIQTIAAVKQQNFFVHNKKINIFKIAKGDDDQISGKQMLKNKHFCGNSIVQKIAKMKLPIYRDLSTMGREVICNIQTRQNIIDYIDSYELSYKIPELIFQDIINLATNRMSADFLNRVMNFQQVTTNKQDDNSSLQGQNQKIIYYRHNQQNAQLNFINTNQQIQQINDYKALNSNEQQKKYEKKYVKQKFNVQEQLQLKKDLRSNTVKDQQLHDELSKNVEMSLKTLVGFDLPRHDADRIVRLNKISKNRNEGLKLKTLLQTLAFKNKYHEQFQHRDAKSKTKRK